MNPFAKGLGDQIRSHLARRTNPVIRAEHGSGGIQDLDSQTKVRGDQGDLRRDGQATFAGIDFDHVDVVKAIDDASAGHGNARSKGRRSGGVTEIIQDRIEVRLDYSDVVLRVIRVGVLALGPLDDVLVVANPHDGRPRSSASAMALKILVAPDICSIMIKPNGVSDLVRASFGHELGAGRGARENETRDIGLECSPDAIERTDIGDTSGTSGILVRTEDNTHAITGITRRGALETLDSRVFRGHIHVKLGIIFHHTAPYCLNGGMFCVTETCGIGIKGKRRGRERGLPPKRVPRGARCRVTGEIEIDFTGSRRTTMKEEGRCRRVNKSRRNRGSVRTKLGLQTCAGIKRVLSGSQEKVVIVVASLREAGTRHAGQTGRFFALGDASKVCRAIGRGEGPS